VVNFVDQGIVPAVLEEEVARLRQEKEQLDQEFAGALETGRRAGEELSNSGSCLVITVPPLFYLVAQRSFPYS
jgi:hypothetical protein